MSTWLARMKEINRRAKQQAKRARKVERREEKKKAKRELSSSVEDNSVQAEQGDRR